MNELALFAGAGGGVLASELLGDRTVCAVERDAYAASILAQRQNDGLLPLFPIWSDVCSFDPEPWRGIVDSVSGGFPCQDISIAGGGSGLDGERSGLWSEFARIVRVVEPGIVRVENSPMLASRGLVRVLADLAAMGFDAEWDVVSAGDLGAWHGRERMWIVAAHPDRLRKLQRQGRITNQRGWPYHRLEEAANADGARLALGEANARGPRRTRVVEPRVHVAGDVRARWGRWPTEPDVVRMVHGVPHRVDRIKCLGNAQVPRVAAAAFAALAQQFN